MTPKDHQSDRQQLLWQASTGILLAFLVFFLSVYVSSPRPKLFIGVAVVLLVLSGKRVLSGPVAPLVAILGYGLFMSLSFPAERPDFSAIIQQPIFSLDCILLLSICAAGRSLRLQHVIILGILAMSIIGLVGEMTGHDMTAILPFDMPNEDYFDRITTDGSGEARLRGFFGEAGVLAAVTGGVASYAILGSVTLLFSGAKARHWLPCLAFASLSGGFALCATLAKSGFVVLAASVAGFIIVLGLGRNLACRATAVGGVLMAIFAAVLFLLFAPSGVKSYVAGELGSATQLQSGNAVAKNSGMVTRSKCWKLAWDSVEYFPLGVGSYGLGSVLAKPIDVQPNDEMTFFFDRGVFGLKNALANLMAETGLVGVGLLFFWLWRNFGAPAVDHFRTNSKAGIFVAALYSASAFCSLAFMASCELYPTLAFLLLLKYHADAVAEAACPLAEEESPEYAPSVELAHIL